MITKQDSLRLQKDFQKVFVTNTRFKTAIWDLKTSQAEIVGELKAMREEIDNKYSLLNNTLATLRSDLMGELQAMREEHSLGMYRQIKHSEQLEDHETRIVGLETKLS